MKEILLYSFLLLIFGFYLKMIYEIWTIQQEDKKEWEEYWEDVFNKAKNNKK
jgi:hypothetical protein